MSLKKYHQKRNFSNTPEPKGKVNKSKGKKLLYIIQKHAASHLHYDFRLELDGVLLSWAVPKGPSLDPNIKRLAMHVEDHPLEYGSFQGIIPKGQYGGGTVMLWDKGSWIPDAEDPMADYKKGHLSFILKGKRLKGRWKLFRINKDNKTWLLVKYKDKEARAAKDFDITLKETTSVTTKQTMEQIANKAPKVWDSKEEKKKPKPKKKVQIDLSHLKKSKFPSAIEPELATLVATPPKGDNWLHEIKLDGYRILSYKPNGKTYLLTRNINDWTNKFKTVADAVNKSFQTSIILDGEVVVLDEEQHSNFQLLQNSIQEMSNNPFVYYVFDILYYAGHDLTSLPLMKRKEILKAIFPEGNPTLRYSDHIVGSGDKIFKEACKLGLEGIVSKNADSLYKNKRTKDWLKIKCSLRQEFVIGGYTPPQGARNHFGSLYLGVYKNKKLIYVGNVGTGFTEKSLKEIYSALKKYQSNKMPFTKNPPGYTTAKWVEPKLLAEVEFSEWTSDGSLRHPSFQGLRTDKSAKSVKIEKPEKILRKI